MEYSPLGGFMPTPLPEDGYQGDYLLDVAKAFIEVHGETYKGDFKGDKMTGKGVRKWKDGAVYEGDFVNGKMEGQGSEAGREGEEGG